MLLMKLEDACDALQSHPEVTVLVKPAVTILELARLKAEPS